jgi:hypothetical protein
MAKVDSLFAGLGAFDSSSGVMFTTEDDTGKKAHWVNAALSRVSADATELPQEVLRWLLADPIFILLKEDPGPRDWRREDLNWGPVPKEEGEERDDSDVNEPYIHTTISIERRLTYGRLARYRLHRFVARDPNAINDAILASQKVQERSGGILATNFGGYHSKRDLFRMEGSECSAIEDFILAAVKVIERKDRAMWESDGESPEIYNEPVREAAEGWVNVSSKGDLNTLHHHSEATWSGVYYVDSGRGGVEGFIGGQLLLRFTRGMTGPEIRGCGNVEPDEDLHVPRMKMLDISDDPAGPDREAVEFAKFGRYAHIDPTPGTLIIFPAWMSHAVAPHRGNGERISVSFNIFLH